MQMDNERTEIDVDEMEFGGDYVPHPEGIYRAEFTHAFGFVGVFKDKDTGKTEQKNRVRMVFTTEAEMENGEPFGISCSTSPSFHSKGKIRPFLTALGEDVAKLDPKTFKLKERYGKKLRLHIIHEPRADGQPGVFSKIAAFLPLKDGATKKPGSNGAAKPAGQPEPEPAAVGAARSRPNFDEEDE